MLLSNHKSNRVRTGFGVLVRQSQKIKKFNDLSLFELGRKSTPHRRRLNAGGVVPEPGSFLKGFGWFGFGRTKSRRDQQMCGCLLSFAAVMKMESLATRHEHGQHIRRQHQRSRQSVLRNLTQHPKFGSGGSPPNLLSIAPAAFNSLQLIASIEPAASEATWTEYSLPSAHATLQVSPSLLFPP